MLCKGGKEKICAMVTGSYNRVPYTQPCVGIILRPPTRCHSFFCHTETWQEKQESAQSTPCRHLHGAQADTGDWVLVLNQAFAERPAGSRAGDNSISPPKSSSSFWDSRWVPGSLIPSEMFSNSWSMFHCLWRRTLVRTNMSHCPTKTIPALCLKSCQEPGGDPSGQAAKYPTTLVSAVLHWQQSYIYTAAWMHKAFFALSTCFDK